MTTPEPTPMTDREYIGNWLKVMSERLDQQTELLRKINEKLAFFVFLALIAIGLSILSMCGLV